MPTCEPLDPPNFGENDMKLPVMLVAPPESKLKNGAELLVIFKLEYMVPAAL